MTVKTTEAAPVQRLASITVTVYVVVLPTVAVGLAAVASDKPVVGVQL